MSDELDTDLDPDVAELVARLERDRPLPGPTLQRRVRGTIQTALHHAGLRRQAVVLWLAGTAFLVVGLVLALNGAPQ